ncbi:hypothetical protein [Thalassospira xiamenensis]|uniref:hypothetical protein n=1 Tax=Thalassospira xiamenensis TaxID=220697 RepID=UPI000DEDE03C|nr:hypothetical protein [Thalassospira xiamenensis]
MFGKGGLFGNDDDDDKKKDKSFLDSLVSSTNPKKITPRDNHLFGSGGLFGQDDKKEDKGFLGDAFHNPYEKTTYRDAHGNRSGYSITNMDSGRSEHFDERGNKVGHSNMGMFGQEYHYDEDNNQVGWSSDGLTGKHHYAKGGRRLGSTSSSGLHRGSNNSRIGTSYGPASYHPGMVETEQPNYTQDLLARINDQNTLSHQNEQHESDWDRVRASDPSFLDAPSSSREASFYDEEVRGQSSGNGEDISDEKSTTVDFLSERTADKDRFTYRGEKLDLAFEWMYPGMHQTVHDGHVVYLDEEYEFLEVQSDEKICVHFGTVTLVYQRDGGELRNIILLASFDGGPGFMRLEVAPLEEEEYKGAIYLNNRSVLDERYALFNRLLNSARCNPANILPSSGRYVLPETKEEATFTFGPVQN